MWKILPGQLTAKDANDGNHKTEVAETRPFYCTILAFFCDALESAMVWAFYGSSKPKNTYLLGTYAPVKESGPEDALFVRGDLPKCLDGEFVRVGPNPKFDPVARYHWFDGDGMLHGLRIKDGKATYVSRFVRTSRLKQEEYWGGAKFFKLGDLRGKAGLVSLRLQQLRMKLGVLDGSNGFGTGKENDVLKPRKSGLAVDRVFLTQTNTALAYHSGKLLSLNEGDKPYIVRVLEDGDLETVGRFDYDNKLDHAFTAHPKVDPITGEMFAYGYQLQASMDKITFRVISKAGVMEDPVPISVSGNIMMHDLAITENYAIIMDCPLYKNPKDMVLKNQFVSSFDETKPARFGVLPRYAKSESHIRWFEVSTCFVFHHVNAWEEGDEVVLVSCRLPTVDTEYYVGCDKHKVELPITDLWEYRFNLKTGEAVERQLGEFKSEFPRINDDYVGRKNQYAYTGIFQGITTQIVGIAKYDLTVEPELGKKELEVGGNVAGLFWHGSHCYGSEAVYVAKNPGMKGDEDDGYLLCFVTDENTGKSEVVVIDAKTMSPRPVAVIELPARVPNGFHAIFVTEEQLHSQKL